MRNQQRPATHVTRPSLARRLIWTVCGALILTPLLYLAAALVLGAIPLNRDWRSADDGVTVWLTTNGVHAGLAMPARHVLMDWTVLFPPVHNAHRNDVDADDYVTVGWGDRTFFLDVPQWRDLKVSTALNAIGGRDGAAMHVEYGPAPTHDATAIPLTMTPEDYARLVAYIRHSTTVDGSGSAIWIPGHHYDVNDAFYEANGRYSLFVTCNQWTRDALAASGVRVPVWSPFDKALFWQLHGQARSMRAA
jgi:uncharacterized protein (TIGR02117 family)